MPQPSNRLERETRGVYCIYHSADDDGRMSACILRTYFYDVIPIMANYGPKLDVSFIPPKAHVFIVDFTLPERDMRELANRCHVIWIDHHPVFKQDSYQEFSGLDGIRSQESSAALLVWKYIYPDHPIPKAVEYISDYDIWKFSHDETLPFHYGSEALNFRPYRQADSLTNMFLVSVEASDYADRTVATGKPIQDYVLERNAIIAKIYGFKTTIAGHPAWAINVRNTNSLILESLQTAEPRPVTLTFGYNAHQKMFRASVYTDGKTIMANEIAQMFRGNGHEGAAGFGFDPDKFPFEFPKPTDGTLPEDYVSTLEGMQGHPLIRQHEEMNLGSLFRSFGDFTTYHGLQAYAVNNPIWTDVGIYQTELHLKVDIALLWSMTASGRYLMRAYPMVWTHMSLEDLKFQIPGSTIVGRSVWAYEDRPPHYDAE